MQQGSYLVPVVCLGHLLELSDKELDISITTVSGGLEVLSDLVSLFHLEPFQDVSQSIQDLRGAFSFQRSGSPVPVRHQT